MRERPVHPVELTNPFYIQTTEVANEQYRRFRPAHVSRPWEGRVLDGPRQPVTGVSWQEATAYADAVEPRGRETALQAADRGRVGVRLPCW